MQQLLMEVKASSEVMVQQYNGELNIELPEPDIEITGNKTALASAIANLIHNSIQVKGAGAKIIVSAKRDINDHNKVCISVSDNGPGVPKELIKKIFEPFFTTKSQGTGLGLAVVSAVANSHQGKVSLIQDQIEGATFNIHLPIFLTQSIQPQSVLEGS
jgi:two-component system sensor histidine kinase FlrB